jgi:hypothetical protein
MGKELRNENIARNVVVKGCASKDAREYATAGLPTCFSNLQEMYMSFLSSPRYQHYTPVEIASNYCGTLFKI